MKVAFYSNYYERAISLSAEDKQILLQIYLSVAQAANFEPEINKEDQLHNPDSYDHVAYHVEELGEEHPLFESIAHLF